MFKRLVATLVCITFIFSNFQYVQAQPAPLQAGDFSINQLPVPGTMISTTPAYVPLTLKGLVVHPENALKFDFLMDTGHSNLKGDALKDEALKIMKYFLTALTIPEDDLWVNLSPYEKNRIIQDNFGKTMMGRDLLAQDYILKQLTASLIYPEKALGKEFWQQVYSKAEKEYGTTQIPVNTFNKVWIVPSEAVVWEHDGKVLIVKSHLKVMLEEDYLALQKNTVILSEAKDFNKINSIKDSSATPQNDAHSLASQIVRAIVLPVLEKEVNEGKNFAQLRQMYQAMILATWYKKALKESILNKVYADKKKITGIGYTSSVIASEAKQSNDIDRIYQQYLRAFKKGAFNYIKEDIDPSTGQTIPRKYFSGGVSERGLTALELGQRGEGVWKGDRLSLPVIEQQAIDAATYETTGSTILVAGDVADVGPVTPSTRSAAMLSGSLSPYLQSALDFLKSANIRLQAWTPADFQQWTSDNQSWLYPTVAAVSVLALATGIYNLNEYMKDKKVLSNNWDKSDDEKVKRHFDLLIRKWKEQPLRKDILFRIIQDLKTLGQTSYFYEMGVNAILQIQEEIDKQLAEVQALNAQEHILVERKIKEWTASGSSPDIRLRSKTMQELEKIRESKRKAEEKLKRISTDIDRQEIIHSLSEVLDFYAWQEEDPSWAIKEAVVRYSSNLVALRTMANYYVKKRANKILRKFLADQDNDVKDIISHLNKFEELDTRKIIEELKVEGINVELNSRLTEELQLMHLRGLPFISLRKALMEGVDHVLVVDPEHKEAIFKKRLAIFKAALQGDSQLQAWAMGEINKLEHDNKGNLEEPIYKEAFKKVFMEALNSQYAYGVNVWAEDKLTNKDEPEFISLNEMRNFLNRIKGSYEFQENDPVDKLIEELIKYTGLKAFADKDPRTWPDAIPWLNEEMKMPGSDLRKRLSEMRLKPKALAIIGGKKEEQWSPQNIRSILEAQYSETPRQREEYSDEVRTWASDILNYIGPAEVLKEEMTNPPNPAMNALVQSGSHHLGGISLNAKMLDLQIRRDGNGVPLPLSQQPLDKINIQGFVPHIISIQPVDLPALFGLNSHS